MTIAFEYFPEYYSIFTVAYFTLINLGDISIVNIELSHACDLAGVRGSSDIYMEHYNTYWNTLTYYVLSIPHVPAVQEAKYMVASGDRKYPHQEYLFAIWCFWRIWLCTFGLLVLHCCLKYCILYELRHKLVWFFSLCYMNKHDPWTCTYLYYKCAKTSLLDSHRYSYCHY